MSQSTRKPVTRKATIERPKKPYPISSLPHASGAWQKKIRGKVHYYGKWARVVNGELTRIEATAGKMSIHGRRRRSARGRN
jgi:hypothetical protein